MEYDNLFIQDDNNAEPSVDMPTTPTRPPAKKRAPKRQKRDSDSRPTGPGASSRGPNWNEDDSIRLVKAAQYSEEKKKCKPTPEISQLTEAWESKEIIQNRMFEHFQSLTPDEIRTKKSLITRWQEMQSKYKLFLCL
jgi:hypothetical protein